MRGEILDGRYELVERLGRGGMGQVWAARDARMHRDVAVKLVTALPRMGEHETFLRFRREIRSAARLPGRYTVIAHDCGEAVLDGERVLYMVMERLTGRTLYDAVLQERPSWQRAVAWARQVAAALDAAHRQGIVHRDIKPENVMFDADGNLKVLDFGIAKFLGDTVLVNGLTGTGVAIGSLLYMSPEQARGERAVDHRTDLYSFGCLLHFMLTGRPPLVADNAYAQMRLLFEGRIEPARGLNPAIPPELDTLVLGLLARTPEERPATARDVLDALSAVDAGTAAAPGRADAEAEAAALREAALEDARELREEARRAAEQYRERAEAAAQQVRADAEAYGAECRTRAEREGARIVGKAKADAAGLLAEAREEAHRALSNDALGGLRRTVAAILAESKFTPVGGLVEQRATILRELTELQTALARVDRPSQEPRSLGEG
ncbi:protein kinase [Streptomyces sp. NPDC052109]|uniref:protein kinase domain-containing protein n=1 Tax=Streptomyces sp. NPDC052109 TaxID=3155527 RepID=UPI00342317D7